MSRNKVIMTIGAVVLLLIALIASVTEYREEPEYEWRERYSFNDEQPQGLYIFKELLERYFTDTPITINGYANDTINTQSLYIQFVPYYLDHRDADTLISIASAGNDVLIIGDSSNDRITDTMPVLFDDVYLIDSSLSFNFTTPKIASDSNFVYTFIDKDFTPVKAAEFQLLEGLSWKDDLQYIKVATPDSMTLMNAFPIGEGRIFCHVLKELFYNHSYQQPQMFEYTQKVLSHFDPDHIYLLNPFTYYDSPSQKERNPLDFIMSQPALKAAYYLLVLGTLLYVFFGGKRKQKIIPVTEKNVNTSLEYIDTVSQLFYQQGQHEKLVFHMRNIFHHKMQKKFFVAPDNPNYLEVLAKKSKISETELKYVMDRFKNLEDNFSFRGDQLVSLNRRLEKIYKDIGN